MRGGEDSGRRRGKGERYRDERVYKGNGRRGIGKKDRTEEKTEIADKREYYIDLGQGAEYSKASNYMQNFCNHSLH